MNWLVETLYRGAQHGIGHQPQRQDLPLEAAVAPRDDQRHEEHQLTDGLVDLRRVQREGVPMLRHPLTQPHRARDLRMEDLTGRLHHPPLVGGFGLEGEARGLRFSGARSNRTPRARPLLMTKPSIFPPFRVNRTR